MTAPRPVRLTLTARMWEILRRCYRGENPLAVLGRALDMLADADGHLEPDGRIKTGRRP